MSQKTNPDTRVTTRIEIVNAFSLKSLNDLNRMELTIRKAKNTITTNMGCRIPFTVSQGHGHPPIALAATTNAAINPAAIGIGSPSIYLPEGEFFPAPARAMTLKRASLIAPART